MRIRGYHQDLGPPRLHVLDQADERVDDTVRLRAPGIGHEREPLQRHVASNRWALILRGDRHSSITAACPTCRNYVISLVTHPLRGVRTIAAGPTPSAGTIGPMVTPA